MVVCKEDKLQFGDDPKEYDNGLCCPSLLCKDGGLCDSECASFEVKRLVVCCANCTLFDSGASCCSVHVKRMHIDHPAIQFCRGQFTLHLSTDKAEILDKEITV